MSGEYGSNRTKHSRPLIGITSYVEVARYGVWETEGPVLPRGYVDAVLRAGGVPVLFPPIGDGYRELAGAIDGLVLSGGADIEPSRYGQEPHPATVTRPERDAFEFALLEQALAAGVPVFGVCRGMEVLNVAFGGTLAQHLPDVVGHREHQPAPAVFGPRRVTTADGSALAAILGAEAKVRCHHHQGVGELAPGLRATAWAEDGTVEAVEATGDGYVLGVQWHPEEDDTDDRLFAALVHAATRYRARNTG